MWFSQTLLLTLFQLGVSVYASYHSVYSRVDGNLIRYKKFSAGSLCDTGADHYTGWADVGHRHIFWWFHEAREDKASKPLAVWLQGGPGGSSMIGLLSENGPCRFFEGDASPDPKYHPEAWTQEFNMLYIDQPAGVGFSYSDDGAVLVDRSEESSLDIVSLLRLFVQEAFPEFRDRPLFLSGESYGGRFVPMLADAILTDNERRVAGYNNLDSNDTATLNLAALMIGNGWSSPPTQYPSAYEAGCHPYLEGLDLVPYFNTTECAHMASIYDRCQDLFDVCMENPDPIICRAAGKFCQQNIDIDTTRENSMYDRRRFCAMGDPKCFETMVKSTDWLNSQKVRDEIEVEAQTNGYGGGPVAALNTTIAYAFQDSGDYFTSSVPQIQRVLAYSLAEKGRGRQGIEVLYYTGVTDLVCNIVGVRRFLHNMKWKNHAEFLGAQWKSLPWLSDSDSAIAGWYKAVDGLWSVEVNEAGHLVPMDQPRSMLKIIRLWMETTRAGQAGRELPQQGQPEAKSAVQPSQPIVEDL